MELFFSMIITENTSEAPLPSTEFEQQDLGVTVPNVLKETVSSQSSLSDLSQNTIPLTEVKNSLHGSNIPLHDEMEIQEASGSAPSTVDIVSNSSQKTKCSKPDSPKSPQKRNNKLNDLPFLPSNIRPPFLKPSAGSYLHRDASLTSELSTEKFQFESQLTSPYMVSTPYEFKLNPNCCIDCYILYASKQ